MPGGSMCRCAEFSSSLLSLFDLLLLSLLPLLPGSIPVLAIWGRSGVAMSFEMCGVGLKSSQWRFVLHGPWSIHIQAWRRQNDQAPAQYPGLVIWCGRECLTVTLDSGKQGRGTARWSGRGPLVWNDTCNLQVGSPGSMPGPLHLCS